jgi:hypothetical protein
MESKQMNYEKEFWMEQQIACMLSEDYVLQENNNLKEID